MRLRRTRVSNRRFPSSQLAVMAVAVFTSTMHFHGFRGQKALVSLLQVDNDATSTSSCVAMDIKKLTAESEAFYESNLQDEGPSLWSCPKSLPEDQSLVLEEEYQLSGEFTNDMERHEAFMKSTKHGKNHRRTGISLNDAKLLNQIIVKKCRAAMEAWGSCTTLETGFALGESTISIMNAHDQAQSSHSSLHYAIDPFHHLYDNVGARGVARYMAAHPTSRVDVYHMNETAALSMASFTKRRTCFDVIFLDDGHRFEQNIMELSLAVDLTAVGGVIIMHDTWMPSIKATISWIKTNLKGVLRVVEQGISPIMLVLVKVGHDKRAWNHFEKFSASYTKDKVNNATRDKSSA